MNASVNLIYLYDHILVMRTTELKSHLHDFIDKINDERFLRVVHAMMKAFTNEEEPSPEEKKLIDERLEHFNNHPDEVENWDDLYRRLRGDRK
ncbi:MAG: hypothetical protein H6585_00085 [Flavobacteriales bacterium]|nr:hypothetical protein [Flavobacteriales bacterium]MCB9446722.1 hypothetical protein [Flavobacteriales bacterium]